MIILSNDYCPRNLIEIEYHRDICDGIFSGRVFVWLLHGGRRTRVGMTSVKMTMETPRQTSLRHRIVTQLATVYILSADRRTSIFFSKMGDITFLAVVNCLFNNTLEF